MAVIEITESTLEKLKYVNSIGLAPGKYLFPDFLIVGPQRTGTSWMHKNLQFHPEIFLPRKKELFFFSNLKIKQQNKTYTSDLLKWYITNFKIFSLNGIKKIIHNLVITGTITVPNVIGEATASYAVMDDDLICEIFLLNPNIKIMLFIRDPIERAWSNAKRILVRDKGIDYEHVPFSEFEKFYKDANQIRGGSYTDIIARWQKHVQPDKLFIGFFDDIKYAPEDLLLRIFEFLQVSKKDKYLRKDVKNTVNPTTKKNIPEEHFNLLIDLYRHELDEINKQYGRSWY